MEKIEALAWTSLRCYKKMLMGCFDGILEKNVKRNVDHEGLAYMLSEGNKDYI